MGDTGDIHFKNGFDAGYNQCKALNADKIDRLQKRVIELEQFQRSLHPTELRDYTLSYYVINNDQIDAAVNMINAWECDPMFTDYESGWDVLNKFGIHWNEKLGWKVE